MMKWLADVSDTRLEMLLGYAFGFAVLGAFILLAMVIGLGHITQEGSFGLEYVLQGLAGLGGGFIGWWHAWHAARRPNNGEKK